MFSQEMLELGSKRSIIRETFEQSRQRAAQIGSEYVFDFSLGNPSVPAPDCVNETLINILQTTDSILVHGYTSAQGDFEVRKTIADSINKRFGRNVSPDAIYMTVGAAASLSICCKALTVNGDEWIVFAPFFPEYGVFINAAGGKFNVVPVKEENFESDLEVFEALISPKTKGVIINSPNNPSGIVYSEATIQKICTILEEKSNEFNHPIYLIADEPYREIVYDEVEVPYLMNYYKNTLVCYSYSKSLSLPGERIGYIAVSDEMQDAEGVYKAICGAGRALGYVCASSLFQYLVAKCIDARPNIVAYKENRDLLYNGLTQLGYECVKPDGAFYLFVKSLEKDANAFAEKAKEYGLFFVPSDGFGCLGYVRIAYCVSKDQIIRSLPYFEALAKEYK